LRPVRHNLKAIRDKPKTDDKEKVSEYGRALIINIKTVGGFIEQLIENLEPSNREKRKKHLWYALFDIALTSRCFVRNFWPSSISHTKLQQMYENVVKREREKAAAKVAAASKGQ